MSPIKLEYIWLGANNELRSKVRVEWVDDNNSGLLRGDLNCFPLWNYDGSSTNQATGDNSEVLIKPVQVYKNPMATSDCLEYLVLCETYTPEMNPHPTNTRHGANAILEADFNNYKPMFGIEHEFFILDKNTRRPLGFHGQTSVPPPQGQYYCSVGSENAYGRKFLNECLDLAIKAGVRVTGSNIEVCPGQVEIQVCNYGIKAADDSIILKYILDRISENYGYVIEWAAKPVKGDWNGSGCHVNYSTKQMRNDGGWSHIMDAINRLSERHSEHIEVYGSDNHERLTGLHETSSMDTFSYGVADRGCSIRIPRSTERRQCGYIEDRRPSSSADMYIVTSKLHQTCVGIN